MKGGIRRAIQASDDVGCAPAGYGAGQYRIVLQVVRKGVRTARRIGRDPIVVEVNSQSGIGKDVVGLNRISCAGVAVHDNSFCIKVNDVAGNSSDGLVSCSV